MSMPGYREQYEEEQYFDDGCFFDDRDPIQGGSFDPSCDPVFGIPGAFIEIAPGEWVPDIPFLDWLADE